MKPTELNNQKQPNTGREGLLGNAPQGDDSNVLTAVTQGFIDMPNSDDNSDISSNGIDFGSGSVFSKMEGGDR